MSERDSIATDMQVIKVSEISETTNIAIQDHTGRGDRALGRQGGAGRGEGCAPP